MNSSTTLSDEDLVDRVRRGEARLFEQLMRRNNRRLYRAVIGILRDGREAEDVMQDAYVRAYTHLADFDGRAKFSTWLTRIAVHEALARLKRARRHESLDDRASESQELVMPRNHEPSPEQSASDREMHDVLERAISALPDDFRVVFMLRAVEEMTGAETAECLGIPEDTVKTRLFRARNRLQEILLSEIEPKASRTFDFVAPRCDRVVHAVFRRLGLDPADEAIDT